MNTIDIKSSQFSGTVLQNSESCFNVNVQTDVPAHLHLILTFDNECYLPQNFKYNLDAGSFSVTIPVPTSTIGFWELEGELLDSDTRLVVEYSAISIVKLPNMYKKKKASSFFGAMFITDYEAATDAGIEIERVQAYWNAIETSKGNYNWTDVDNKINECVANGISAILTLRPEIFSYEIKTNWRGYSYPYDLIKEPIVSYYKEFIKKILLRYGDKIDYMEVLNEPDLEFMDHWGFSVDLAAPFVARLNQISYDYIKEISPQTPVIALSVSGGDDYKFIKSVIEAIPEKQFDLIAPHPYPPSRQIVENQPFDWPEDYKLRENLIDLQKYLEEHNLPTRLACTEIGYTIPDFSRPLCYSSEIFASALARTFIVMKSIQNMEFVTWFDFDFYWDQFNEPDYSFVRADKIRYPYPAMNAFSTVTYILNDCQPVGDIKTSSAIQIWEFVDKISGRIVLAIWSDEEGFTLSFPQEERVKYFDYFGREIDCNYGMSISCKPMYIEFKSRDFEYVAAD